MKLVIEITMDNDAFVPEPGDEVARILHLYAKDITGCPSHDWLNLQLRDTNGNHVGRAHVEVDD